MLSQGSQGAAGRAERSAAWVGEGSATDRVVLEGTCLAARTEVRVGRRFHGRHAGVIGVQVRVIHLIHGDQPVRAPVCCRDTEEGTLGREGFWCVFSRLLLLLQWIQFKPVRSGLPVPQYPPRTAGSPLQDPCQLRGGAVRDLWLFFFFFSVAK